MTEPGKPAPPHPRPHARWRWLRRLLALGALAGCGGVALGAWVLGTESGLRFAATQANRLTHGRVLLENPSGRLADHFAFSHLHLAIRGTQIDVRAADVRWRLSDIPRRRLLVQRLDVGALQVTYLAKGGYDTPLDSLALPLTLQLDDVRVGQLAVLAQRPGHAPARVFGLASAQARGILAPARWQIKHLGGTTDWGAATLSGEMDTRFPFALQAQGILRTRYEPYTVDAKLQASESLAHLNLAFDATGADLSARGTLAVRCFDAQPLGALQIEAGVIDPHRFHPDAPAGAFTLRAQLAPALDAAKVPQAAKLGTRQVEGVVLLENARPGPLNAGQLPLERFAARVNWAEGHLGFKQIDARLQGGGRLEGQWEWRAGDALGQFEGRLQVAEVDPSRLHTALPRGRVGGELHARVQRDAQWVEAHLADARLRADVVLNHQAGLLQVISARLAQGSATVAGQGSLRLDAPRRFNLDARAQGFDPHAFWTQAPSGSLSGHVLAQGQIGPQPALSVQLDLANSHLAGLPVTGGGSFALVGTRITQSNFTLEVLGNQMAAQGAFGQPGDRLAVNINAPALDRLGAGLAGRVRARAEIAGSLEQPAGTLDLTASRLALPGGLRLDALNFQGQLSEGRDGRVDTRITLAGLRRSGAAEQLVRRAAVVAVGTRRDHLVSVDLQFLRAWRVSAAAQGGLSERLDWQGQLTRLKLDWGAALTLAAPARLAFGPTHFQLGTARLTGAHSALLLDALSWSPQEIVSRGSLSGLRVGLALNESQQVVAQGESLQLGANWDISLREHANGQLRVFREEGDLVLEGDAPVALGLTELEGVLAANDDRLAFSLSAAGKRIGVISASATAAVERHGFQWQFAENAPLLGSAHIEVPSLNWVGPLLDPNLRTAGSVQGDFSLAGTPAVPVATGAIRGEDLALSLAEQGFRLQGGKLRLRFDADRLYLDELAFVSPNRVKPDERRIDLAVLTAQPGRAAVHGEVALGSGQGAFALTADRLPIMQRRDRWLLISGAGHIDTTWDSMRVQAQVTAPAGYFGLAPRRAPQLDDDVVVRGRLARSERRFLISTDIDVSIGDAFYLKAFGVDTRLEGQVSLHARPGEPLRATGQIETRDGLYDAYGQRLSIDEGLITFQGPLDNPSLAVTAVRKGLAVEAGVSITGSAQRPKVRLVSQPNVPDAEKLSWMILGRPPSGGSEADSALLVAAAGALVGDTTGGVTDQIARALGLDQIALAQAEARGLGRAYTSQVAGSATGFASTSAASADTVGGQVVVLGKRLTQDVYLSFEQSLTGSESIVRLTYALSRHISVILRGGTENALDFSYNISFR